MDDNGIKHLGQSSVKRLYMKPTVIDLGAVREVTRGPNGSFNDGGGVGQGMAGSAVMP